MALYITVADLEALQDPDVFIRLFDKDGDGTADIAWINRCIAVADSKVKMKCYSAFGADFDVVGGTVDEAIKAMVCAYAFMEAVHYSPLYTGDEKSAFIGLKKEADEFFASLVKDFNNRVRTSGVGRAQPVAAVVNITDQCNVTTRPFGDAADKITGSGF